MKKFLLTALFVVTFFAVSAPAAAAGNMDTVKVGLKYGTGALFSANLENAAGSGYAFGYYDDSRAFVPLGSAAQTKLSVTAAGDIYLSSGGTYSDTPSGGETVIGSCHVQLGASYPDYQAAAAAAAQYPGGYPAYIGDAFRVRVGCYASAGAAQEALGALGVSGSVVSSAATGVVVTVTGTAQVLFEFDCQGAKSLAILPNGQGGQAVTWFKGYRYAGGFEYNRITGGSINVVNVVGLEDYVKGVIPYEMSGSWPSAALEAQAVCARTYVCRSTKHLASYGFDVCSTTDCQVYYGLGGGTVPSAASNAAVDATAGQCLYANGALAEAVYFSSDGGATESAENVWGSAESYLVGKADPYEATISIPNYTYTVSYTPAQLTWVLQNSGYSIGTVKSVFVSERTAMGNVYKVTFVDTSGKTLTVKGEKCRTIFYSTTYGKSVRSMRFDIAGGGGAALCVNSAANQIASLSGVSVISGSGTVSAYSGTSPYVITSSGTAAAGGGGGSAGDSITITGTGSGHNVGMSQWGAYAMAQQGYGYLDILNFYYTGVTVW